MNTQQSRYRNMTVVLDEQPIEVQEISRLTVGNVDFSVYVHLTSHKVFILTDHHWLAAKEVPTLIEGLRNCQAMAAALADQTGQWLVWNLEFTTNRSWAHLITQFHEAGKLGILPRPPVFEIWVTPTLLAGLASGEMTIVDIFIFPQGGESH